MTIRWIQNVLFALMAWFATCLPLNSDVLASDPDVESSKAGGPGEVLLEDSFSRGKPGSSPETVGWTLDNKRGNSRWVLAEDGVCQVYHVTKQYALDSLRREVDLPSRYCLDFEARFQEHAGHSFVAVAGRGGASFEGQGKVVLWKVLPNKKQGFGWQTVPKPIQVGAWHRFRIFVDIDEKVQQFYVDDMSKPAFREQGRDLRLQPDPKQPAARFVEFRDYGLGPETDDQ